MSATKLGVPSGEHGARSGERKALSLRQRATVHRRAAEVCVMLAQIEDTLRCYGQSWFEGASAEDREDALEDLRRLDDQSYVLEANLAISQLPGGAR